MKKAAKNKAIIAALFIFAVLAVGAAVYVKMTQPKYTPGSTADTANHAGPKNDTAPAPATAPQPNLNQPSTSTLPKPIGPNNNTSSISLSGPTSMESVCRSIEGASCHIQATRGGQTIKVSPAKTIGSETYSDGVILNWDAKQLTVGRWSVQAVAVKDGQTALSDPQALEVRP